MASDEEPWKDQETLEELYWNEGLSQREIGNELGTSQGTISYWFDKFDIEQRDFAEACKGNNRVERCSFTIDEGGHEKVYAYIRTGRGSHKKKEARIHQLIEIAKGKDPYKVFSNGEYETHHINGIPWDNRPDNTILLSYNAHKLVTFMEQATDEEIQKAIEVSGVEL